jgi:hypothetical protein
MYILLSRRPSFKTIRKPPTYRSHCQSLAPYDYIRPCNRKEAGAISEQEILERMKGEKIKGTAILVNPWIYDFAAHDLWAKPLGLLTIASRLRQAGFPVALIDCLDTHHPSLAGKRPKRSTFGTGKFPKREVAKPPPLAHVERRYHRYGIDHEAFAEDISSIQAPSFLLITSLMTYWYPGVVQAVRIAKEIHPNTPVILGGIYARLCPGHAKEVSRADIVWDGSEEISFLTALLKEKDIPPVPRAEGIPGYAAFDLLHGIDYICISASRGCPLSCSYCAARFLNPSFSRRRVPDVIREITYWSEQHGVEDFAFYDDALLIGDEAEGLLTGIIRLDRGLRFHTPNAVHASRIDKGMARLLFDAGFRTIRLGLETSRQNRAIDKKLNKGEFERAADALLEAGFKACDLGAYVLAGLPDQEPQEVLDTIHYVGALGIPPFVAEYSPIPKTGLWKRAKEVSNYDIEGEPLFQNNSLLPCWDREKRAIFRAIKREAKGTRDSCMGRESKEQPCNASTHNILEDRA